MLLQCFRMLCQRGEFSDLPSGAPEKHRLRHRDAEGAQRVFRAEIASSGNDVADDQKHRPDECENPERPCRNHRPVGDTPDLDKQKQKDRQDEQNRILFALEAVSGITAQRAVRNRIGEVFLILVILNRSPRHMAELMCRQLLAPVNEKFLPVSETPADDEKRGLVFIR